MKIAVAAISKKLFNFNLFHVFHAGLRSCFGFVFHRQGAQVLMLLSKMQQHGTSIYLIPLVIILGCSTAKPQDRVPTPKEPFSKPQAEANKGDSTHFAALTKEDDYDFVTFEHWSKGKRKGHVQIASETLGEITWHQAQPAGELWMSGWKEDYEGTKAQKIPAATKYGPVFS